MFGYDIFYGLPKKRSLGLVGELADDGRWIEEILGPQLETATRVYSMALQTLTLEALGYEVVIVTEYEAETD